MILGEKIRLTVYCVQSYGETGTVRQAKDGKGRNSPNSFSI